MKWESIREALDFADSALSEAKKFIGRPASSIRQSYYACYRAALAVFMVVGNKTKAHAAVQEEFPTLITEHFSFPLDLVNSLENLGVDRIAADYSAVKSAKFTISDAEEALSVATRFVQAANIWILQYQEEFGVGEP